MVNEKKQHELEYLYTTMTEKEHFLIRDTIKNLPNILHELMALAHLKAKSMDKIIPYINNLYFLDYVFEFKKYNPNLYRYQFVKIKVKKFNLQQRKRLKK